MYSGIAFAMRLPFMDDYSSGSSGTWMVSSHPPSTPVWFSFGCSPACAKLGKFLELWNERLVVKLCRMPTPPLQLLSRSISLTTMSQYGHPVGASRVSCICFHICKTYDHRRDILVWSLSLQMPYRMSQGFGLHKFKIPCRDTLTYVTASYMSVTMDMLKVVP